MTELSDDRLEKLIEDMARPVWILRSANGLLRSSTQLVPGRREGAATRRTNALAEIRRLVAAVTEEGTIEP